MGALSTRASGTQQEDHSRLRPLCYRGVDVFILSSPLWSAGKAMRMS